jgi:hypothetical protein
MKHQAPIMLLLATRELIPVLHDIVAWHLRGTRFNIHCDPQDGLI